MKLRHKLIKMLGGYVNPYPEAPFTIHHIDYYLQKVSQSMQVDNELLSVDPQEARKIVHYRIASKIADYLKEHDLITFYEEKNPGYRGGLIITGELYVGEEKPKMPYLSKLE